MNARDYSALAVTTAIYPNNGKNIIYPVFGLIGETGELLEKVEKIKVFNDSDITEIGKEIGDIFWYVNAICMELSADFGEIIDEANFIKDKTILNYDAKGLVVNCLIKTSKISEKTKKIIRDNGGKIDDKYKQYVIGQLLNIVSDLLFVIEELHLTLNDVLRWNIEKLFSRKERGKLGGSGDNR